MKQYRLTSPIPSVYHCDPQFSARFSSRHAEVPRGSKEWKARLRFGLGTPWFFIKVPLRGKLVKDGSDTVRMRIGDGWDVDIYKTMILAVEEDGMVLLPS